MYRGVRQSQRACLQPMAQAAAKSLSCSNFPTTRISATESRKMPNSSITGIPTERKGTQYGSRISISVYHLNSRQPFPWFHCLDTWSLTLKIPYSSKSNPTKTWHKIGHISPFCLSLGRIMPVLLGVATSSTDLFHLSLFSLRNNILAVQDLTCGYHCYPCTKLNKIFFCPCTPDILWSIQIWLLISIEQESPSTIYEGRISLRRD